MFKTIRMKTILMQATTMLIMICVVFVLFTAFFDDYYFNRKMGTIERAYQYVSEANLDTLEYADEVLVRYRDQNIKFLITNENFESIFKDERNQAMAEKKVQENNRSGEGQEFDRAVVNATINAKIRRYIIKKVEKFKPQLTLKNKKHRICGYGTVTQNHHKYYIYIYETKNKMKIGFSYNKMFLFITGALAAVAGIIVSIWMSNKISKPIKQIESTARQAIDNKFDVHIDEEQDFQELSSLSKSMNIMMCQIRDQMKTLEQEITQKTIAEERRKQFVHNVSHEMKTPLAIISSQVEMLGFIKDEEKKKAYCDSIIEETANMSEMINDMLVVYSAQSDIEIMSLERTDIGQLVDNVCEKYKDLFNRNKLILHFGKEKNCFANVNQRYFLQAIDNYITNSVKHSPENGNIYVRVMSNNDYVRIEVENQGPHIPDEYKEKIWDMFYKGDVNETLKGQKGSGLGLYLVKSIVELHKGNCGFKNLENGIVFWIEIPKA